MTGLCWALHYVALCHAWQPHLQFVQGNVRVVAFLEKRNGHVHESPGLAAVYSELVDPENGLVTNTTDAAVQKYLVQTIPPPEIGPICAPSTDLELVEWGSLDGGPAGEDPPPA